ncbi:gap junction alpha-4 protein isoform X2 [Brachyhypopomus gauderio]|uniref:gap junction alpha-4 protein isoform X2 n=1 Tax=Brachyhypopomus gauderio TaxID=698409 RepID=UPI00404128BE
MSKADWGFLEHLLKEGQEYSTDVGRVWLTVLFLFRLLVLGTAAESAWDDEQSDFVCNTKQPGCEAVCYDKAFPVSHFRYFVLQVIFVSTPTIFYFAYVTLQTRKAQKQEEGAEGQRGRQHHGKASADKLEVIHEEDEQREKQVVKKKTHGSPPKLKGKLLGVYAVSIALKVVLEVGFIVGLWFLYGFVIPERYECRRDPCPHTVDCFVSRPTEKTIFTIYTQVIAAISALLNILELFHLLQLSITRCLEKKYEYQGLEAIRVRDRTPTKLELTQVETVYQEKGHLFLPAENSSYTQSNLNWTERDLPLTDDMLPAYANCVRSNSHRSDSKKPYTNTRHA